MRLQNGDVLLAWPLAMHVITAGWTYNSGKAHNAIDLRAAVNTPVFAAEDGVVDWTQDWDGHTTSGMMSYGNGVRIQHANYAGGMLQTRYAHLKSRCVKTGDRVIWKGVRRNPLYWLDNDFTCKDCNVEAHLGSYVSVVRPAAALFDVLLSRMSAGDKDRFVALAKELSVDCSVSEVK